MKIKRKNKIGLIAFLIITIILFTSFKSISVFAVDDNYSTYLYNQNINVDNDKAHLLSEQSDGSNSYRNILQSDFLFPAKLQSSMFSTSQTSSFSHYSFNQFYFDNLDNDYAYQSNDISENFENSIIPNEFDIINGSNIVNGSLEKQDSEFGKYNATYNFDNYQETESNYGNYNATYSFENEIGLTGMDIEFVNFTNYPNSISVINDLSNHKSVLNLSSQVAIEHIAFNHFYSESEVIGMREFWFSTSDNTERQEIYFLSEISQNCINLAIYGGTFQWRNGSGWQNTGISVINNRFYHLKIEYDCNTDLYNWIINGIEFNCNFRQNSDYIYFVKFDCYTSGNYNIYIDAFGNPNDDFYNENDNTNPYGLQSELENDNFTIDYSYGNSISIMDNLDYKYNIINITDNSDIGLLRLINSFFAKDFGIVELNIKTSITDKTSQIVIGTTSLSWQQVNLRISINKFQYYNGTWNDVGLVALDNTWYNIKIDFNCITDSWFLYIDNIYYGNYSYLVPTNTLSSLMFQSGTSNDNYSFYIDNLDYSWTNGYYDNRINDLIPLNNSNYNMYKNEIGNEVYFDIFPDSDITTEWFDYPSVPTTHFDDIDDFSHDASFVYFTDSNKIEQFSFENISIIENIDILRISAILYADGSLGSNDLKACIYDGNTYTDYQVFEITSSTTFENINIFFEVNYTQNQINNLEVKWLSNSVFGSTTKLYSLNVSGYYKDNKISIESESNIDYNENGLPVLNTLYYRITSDKNNLFNISIYNYDIENYYEIKNYRSFLDFNEYSFIFNESAYYRFNKFKLKIESVYSYDFNLFIDKLSLNITYTIQNSNGYQEIIIYNHRYDDSDNYKGYSRFELLIYNESIKYRYSEINFETDDFIYAWIEYNTSNIEVENIELQSHCRYGLNTLDIEIINFYYIIYINYDDDNAIEFREQSRKELQTHKIKSSFNYTSYTRNYLDLTGIIGNYSYNTFKGCRSLYGATTEIFHRNFIIPFFSDDIDVSIPLILPDDSFSNPQEPEPPTPYYWEYETFRTEYYQEVPISIGNWTVQFSQMRSTTYKAKYFYNPNSITRDQLGSWKWKIKFTSSFSYTVDFNFMRNAVISIINLILLFIQWIMFLCVASLSYIFMYLGTTILVFLWNVLVYALFYALIYVIWYLYLGLYMLVYYIWEGLVWIYMNLLIPFFEWFWNEGIPIIIEWLIIILAHIITIIIYLITLGDVDYDTTYDTVYLMLRYIADEIIEAITVFVKHLDYILLFVLYYLLLLGLLYIRYIYVKARGFNNRAEQLKKAFDVFSMPVIWTIDLFRETKELVNPYS